MILQNGKTIHIQTKNTSYVIIRNHEDDLLMHRGITVDYAFEDFTTVTMELKKI